MSEPITPTGKRLAASTFHYGFSDHSLWSRTDIARIEEEAAALERERLRAIVVDGHDPLIHVRYGDGADFWEPLSRFLADAEPVK